MSWPAKLKPGIYDQPVISLDFFATAMAQTGGTLPVGKKQDSVNLIPYLTSAITTAPHETLFWRGEGPGGNYAARQGNWKLVRLGKQPAELYDLATDPGETKNLAAEKPEVLAKLVAAVAEWEKDTVLPAFEPQSDIRSKRKRNEESQSLTHHQTITSP